MRESNKATTEQNTNRGMNNERKIKKTLWITSDLPLIHIPNINYIFLCIWVLSQYSRAQTSCMLAYFGCALSLYICLAHFFFLHSILFFYFQKNTKKNTRRNNKPVELAQCGNLNLHTYLIYMQLLLWMCKAIGIIFLKTWNRTKNTNNNNGWNRIFSGFWCWWIFTFHLWTTSTSFAVLRRFFFLFILIGFCYYLFGAAVMCACSERIHAQCIGVVCRRKRKEIPKFRNVFNLVYFILARYCAANFKALSIIKYAVNI